MRHLFTLFLFLSVSSSFAQNFEVYVSDAGNFQNPPWQILKYDGEGNNPSVYISGNLNWPQEILFLEDSNTVLISNFGDGRITRHHLPTGVYLSDFATGISGPTRIKIGPDSLLYVLQWSGNNKVRRYQLDGTLVDEFTDVGVAQSIGLDWDDQGNLYVSSFSDDLVHKFDTGGISQGVFIDSNLLGPTNIWFDTNGDLLVVDYSGTAVKRYDTSGNYLNDFISGLDNAEGVDFFPNGDILIGDGGTSSIKLFDSNGVFIKDFISSGSGNLLTPNGVTIREVDAVSVGEIRQREEITIVPTIGSSFSVLFSKPDDIKRMEVYTLLGTLVEEIKGTSWNANSYAEGIYLITVHLTDGSIHAQKIMVRK